MDSKSKGGVWKLIKFWIRWSIEPKPWLDHFGPILGFLIKNWRFSNSVRVRDGELWTSPLSQFRCPEFESDLRFSPSDVLRPQIDHFLLLKFWSLWPFHFHEFFDKSFVAIFSVNLAKQFQAVLIFFIVSSLSHFKADQNPTSLATFAQILWIKHGGNCHWTWKLATAFSH